jgi:hypothetical protein
MSRLAASLFASLFALAPNARAQFAEPPGDHAYRRADSDYDGTRDRDEYRDYRRAGAARSTVRLLTGPALRLGDGHARAGLFAAADVGSGAAGFRASGTWIGTGTEGGFSLYGAELWIDFARESDLHPIIAAGAGLGRLDHERADDPSKLDTADIGVALLRATLQYRLPVEGVDARAGIDLSGNVRAFGPAEYTKGAWATAAATVGIGF